MVITTKPHYNPSEAVHVTQPLSPAWGGLLATSSFGDALVIHTAIPRKSANVVMRLVGWAGFHVLSVLAAAFRLGKVDAILAPSPPLTVGLAAWLIGVLKRAPFVYNVQELYPDTAVALGVLGDGALVRSLHVVEKFIYNRAFAVTTIAAGMASAIRKRTDDPGKVRFIPNFVDTRVISSRPRDNRFSREFGLSGRFSVVYAGNIGPAQDLGILLDAAELTLSDSRIIYVMVGEGTSRAALAASAAARHLTNVVFIPQQPYERVPDIYGASDLCVVPLAPTLVVEAVPSKVYRIMAAERRVLAIADKNSDLAEVVRESGAGCVVEPRNRQELARAIVEAANDPAGISLVHGREYVISHADRARVTGEYSRLLDEAADSRAIGLHNQ